MPPFEHAAIVWTVIALVIAWFLLGSLRVIGFEYHNAVLWHNLRVKVQALRQQQARRLKSLQRDEPPPRARSASAPAPAPAPAAPAEGIEVADAIEVEMAEAA